MKKPMILIVDDERNLPAVLRLRLSALGYRVVETCDGPGAIQEYPKGTADVMILDYERPNGDGPSVACMIRTESHTPTVFVSGRDREEFRSIVMQLRDVRCLVRPPDTERMSQLLASIVEPPRVTDSVA